MTCSFDAAYDVPNFSVHSFSIHISSEDIAISSHELFKICIAILLLLFMYFCVIIIDNHVDIFKVKLDLFSKMPRGIKLNEEKTGQIKAYRNCGMSKRQIAKKIDRSLAVVNNFGKLKENYCKIKRTCPVSKITRIERRSIITTASKKNLTASKVSKASHNCTNFK